MNVLRLRTSPARHMLQTLTAAALSLVLGTAAAASLADVRSAFNGLRDGKSSPDVAVAIVEDYLADNSGSPLAIAYMGSVRTIQGAKATTPWKRLAYIDKGFSLLDRAVAMLAASAPRVPDPVAVEVLLVSGITNASVPKLFKRRAAAQANLESLLTRPDFEQLDGHSKALVYAWLAVLTSAAQPLKGAIYLAHARRLNQQLAEDIWSKR
ncbi:hypothetical protein [Sulfuritalea sp.]|uniref:hypothetical protein n=1 Tax=Sulfuritalea sp. TaxID=2480090 RepID=UPI00286DA709|nr:hypothetical protein [Sulfuritalea sp.]